MKVLLVGASGTVGIAVHKELANHGHSVRCEDIAPPRHDLAEALELFGYDPATPGAEWICQDITAPDAAGKMAAGVDAVAYLAYSLTTPDAQFAVNIGGPLNLLNACVKLNVPKFVYASSVSVNWPRGGETVTEQTPPRLGGLYAATKWLTEGLLREFSLQHGLRTIALRLGTVCPHLQLIRGLGVIPVDVRDVARAFRLALEDTRIQHDVLHVVSQGTSVPCDPTHAKEVLGFEAEFNGPEHFAAVFKKQQAFMSSKGIPAA
jgi:nucleoside-diphosphate-sugar epimerase